MDRSQWIRTHVLGKQHIERTIEYIKGSTKIADLLFEDLFTIHYQIVLVAKISAGQKAPPVSPRFICLCSVRKEHCENVLKIGFVGSVFCFERSSSSQATQYQKWLMLLKLTYVSIFTLSSGSSARCLSSFTSSP